MREVSALGWLNGNWCAKHPSKFLKSLSAIVISQCHCCIWIPVKSPLVSEVFDTVSISPILQSGWPKSDMRNWTVNRSTAPFFQDYWSKHWTIGLGNIYHLCPLNSSRFHSSVTWCCIKWSCIICILLIQRQKRIKYPWRKTFFHRDNMKTTLLSPAFLLSHAAFGALVTIERLKCPWSNYALIKFG